MMANLFEDIQSVGSDTRLPMPDRSDFESRQQRICLYCLGKENRENILQSIDECSFKMVKFIETLADGALGLERDRVVLDLTPEEKKRPKIDDKAHFELKAQFLKELRDNTFSGLDNEDANEHIRKVLEIVDLFHIPEVTQDQIIL
nr:hypothetical protein [Tanacetum cinerariifolium]